jgi:hypothetical protein
MLDPKLPDFVAGPSFMTKSVQNSFLTLLLKPFGLQLQIRRYIHYQKLTARYNRYKESSTYRIVDTETHRLIDTESHLLQISLILRVADSPYR